jgi:ribonuclease E
VAQLPVDVATFLINEKREWLHQVESQRETEIVLVPDPNMQTPNYAIRRVRADEMALPENALTSYQMAGQGTVELDFKSQAEKRPPAVPAAVQQIAPAAPAPAPTPPVAREPRGPGLWSRLLRFLRGSDRPAKADESESGSAGRNERHGGRHPRDHHDQHGARRHSRPERGPRRDRDRDRNRNRDRDHDRERNRPQDRDRNRPEERARSDAPRDDASRHRDRPHEQIARPQPAPGQAQDQPGGEGESQRRRRRRRGRGGRGGREGRQDLPGTGEMPAAPQGNGNGDTRHRLDAPQPPMQPPMTQPQRVDAPADLPVATAPPPPAPPPAPVVQQAPVAPPPIQTTKPAQTYTVWSSTPGEGQHFDPKE